MKTAERLIVFAKAPEPGHVKTRLVPALGQAGAAALATRLLEHAVRQAVASGAAALELCVAPDTRHPVLQGLARAHGLELSAQGDGDLGARMRRALERGLTQAGSVCLMGSDAPGLDAASLREAFRALTRHDAVFAPAFDGGYALVGLRRAVPTIFDAMPWSTAQVMQRTRERLASAGISHAELATVHDIDEPADLQHLPPGWL